MKRLRIVITGLIGSIPMAGLTLHYLQYVIGFRKLGHEVLYLEDTGSWNYDPQTDFMTDDISLPIKYLHHIMDRYDLSDAWTFIDHTGAAHGLTGKDFDDYLKTADLFINVTGAGIVRENYRKIPKRIYIDTDPGFIQLRVEQGSKKDIEHLQMHTSYFTFGCNIGKPGCSIPPCGKNWHPTRQPIVMNLWPFSSPPPKAPFTTILKWQAYDPIEHKGEIYGLKNIEFLRFLNLPDSTDSLLEIAMTGKPPVDDLMKAGWKCNDARKISDTIENYQNYIMSSHGEWSIAKNTYVKTHSGWFSDRSAAYLAMGRPVILQSTGFEEWLKTGQGIISFTNFNEAVAAINSVNKDYEFHCRAAHDVAKEFFDSDKVLLEMLKTVYSE